MVQGRYRGPEENVGAGEEKKEVAPPSGFQKLKRYLFIALGAVVFLILLLFVGDIIFKFGLVENLQERLHGGARAEKIIKEPEFMYEIPEIVVNFDGPDRCRFLSIKFYLGFDEPKLQRELEKRMPEIRDAINNILWVKSVEDIETLEGKDNLKEEIFDTVNDMLNSGELRGVYFWHLMFQ